MFSLINTVFKYSKDPTGEGTQEDPTGEGTQEDPTGEGTQEDPTGEGTQEDPTGEGTQEDPTGEGTQEDPTGEGTQEDPTGEGTQEDPTGEENRLKSCINECILLYKNNKVSLYKSNVNFLKNIPIWSYQRNINNIHINNLLQELKIKRHFIGTFKIIKCDNNIRLIDGQHRYYSILEMLKEDENFNMDIFLEIYETDSFDSELSKELFINSNNVLNIKEADNPSNITSSIIKNLENLFPNIMKEVSEQKKRCNKPYINKRLLYQHLKLYIEKNTTFTKEEIINKIISKNIEYSHSSYYWINSGNIKDRISLNTREKAVELKCYLGLKDINIWLNEI
jgi:hypothetical protein